MRLALCLAITFSLLSAGHQSYAGGGANQLVKKARQLGVRYFRATTTDLPASGNTACLKCAEDALALFQESLHTPPRSPLEVIHAPRSGVPRALSTQHDTSSWARMTGLEIQNLLNNLGPSASLHNSALAGIVRDFTRAPNFILEQTTEQQLALFVALKQSPHPEVAEALFSYLHKATNGGFLKFKGKAIAVIDEMTDARLVAERNATSENVFLNLSRGTINKDTIHLTDELIALRVRIHEYLPNPAYRILPRLRDLDEQLRILITFIGFSDSYLHYLVTDQIIALAEIREFRTEALRCLAKRINSDPTLPDIDKTVMEFFEGDGDARIFVERITGSTRQGDAAQAN